MIFILDTEAGAAVHFQNLANSHYALSKDKDRKLAYEYAVTNDVRVPQKWLYSKNLFKIFGWDLNTVMNRRFRLLKQLR